MMPIFFHLQSHLWIAYLFIFNGLLISCYLRHRFAGYRNLTFTFEAGLLSAFFISIALNGVLLLLLQITGSVFQLAAVILPGVSILLSILLYFSRVSVRRSLKVDWSVLRILLYGSVFVILFYNGGLIERITDAWWHMSLANKIALENTFVPTIGHLDAMPTRYYPPLWHGNLALATLVSGESLPILWNSFTAWGGVLKTMGFFLFASALLSSKRAALLAVLLFVLLPGMGDSFLRVSAWPSHIAYMAWFSLMFVTFQLLNQIAQSDLRFEWRSVAEQIPQHAHLLISGATLCVIIYFSHKAELLYFFLAFLFYYFGLVIHRNCRAHRQFTIERPAWLVDLAGRLALLVILAYSAYFIIARWTEITSTPDLLLMAILPLIVLTSLLWLSFHHRRDGALALIQIGLLLLIGCCLLVSIDMRHLISLFKPELAYPPASFNEYPLAAVGWFGSELMIPGWHLQLRSGLLYSGVVSLPLAIWFSIMRPNRTTIFLAANATAAVMLICSPYLYHWFKEILDYHSPWRVAMLIFHPIVIAVALQQCWYWIRSAGAVRHNNA